jgi:hypothetical protein
MKFQIKTVKKFIIKYKSFTLLTTVFAIGFIFGACFYAAGLSKPLALMTAELSENQAVGTALRFVHFVSAPLIFAALMCLFGFCAVGQPFCAFIVFIRGAGLSLSIAGIYSFYGLKGVPITLLLILPPAVLTNVALLACAKWSIKFSNISLAKLRKKSAIDMTPMMFMKKLAPVLLLIAISGLADGVLNAVFGWLT